MSYLFLEVVFHKGTSCLLFFWFEIVHESVIACGVVIVWPLVVKPFKDLSSNVGARPVVAYYSADCSERKYSAKDESADYVESRNHGAAQTCIPPSKGFLQSGHVAGT